MSDAPARWASLGDSAIILTFGESISPATHRQVLEAAARIHGTAPAGVLELVPAYTTLGIWFDPRQRDGHELADSLLNTLSGPGVGAPPVPEQPSREHVITVNYDGPDLGAVAEQTGLSPGEVISRHSGRTYRVYMLGFVPGFGYLGDLDPALVLPRRTVPRQRVPAGSVAIAGAQTGVYPLETPGGWHLIGRTDVVLFDPAREPPALLRAGDTVRFEPVR